MCGNITLHSRVIIHKPSASNVTPRFKYCVINDILHVWKSVLELVRHQQAGEPSANGEDLDSLGGICELGGQLERIAGRSILCRSLANGFFEAIDSVGNFRHLGRRLAV